MLDETDTMIPLLDTTTRKWSGRRKRREERAKMQALRNAQQGKRGDMEDGLPKDDTEDEA